ncbi:MAG: hypothetical protein Q9173_007078 [Seirophora scorigena]
MDEGSDETDGSYGRFQLGLGCLNLCDPEIPKNPSENGGSATQADDRFRANLLSVDGHETADEDRDGRKVLHDNGGVSNQGPKVVGLKAWIALQVR